MVDITAGTTLKQNTPLAGVNLAIIETAATADDGDTIELDTLLEVNGLGARVKKILFCQGVIDPTGTPLAEPPKWTDTNDTITLGGSTDNKRRDIAVWWK